MKLVFNEQFEKVVNDEIITLFKDEVDTVFVLNKIESLILSSFETPFDAEEAYKVLLSQLKDVTVTERDYYDFIKQLQEKRILVEVND